MKGILCFGIGTAMRDGDRQYMYAALDRQFPGLKQKYIKRYGYAYACASDHSEELMKLFHSECEAHGVMHDVGQIFEYMHEYEQKDGQPCLF